jgi:hypothetical protein
MMRVIRGRKVALVAALSFALLVPISAAGAPEQAPQSAPELAPVAQAAGTARVISLGVRCDAGVLSGGISTAAPFSGSIVLAVTVQRRGTLSQTPTGVVMTLDFGGATSQTFSATLPAAVRQPGDIYLVSVVRGGAPNSTVLQSNRVTCAEASSGGASATATSAPAQPSQPTATRTAGGTGGTGSSGGAGGSSGTGGTSGGSLAGGTATPASGNASGGSGTSAGSATSQAAAAATATPTATPIRDPAVLWSTMVADLMAKFPTPQATTTAVPVVESVLAPFTASLSGQVEVHTGAGGATVTLPTGALAHVPDQWCPAERVYRAHVRLADSGIAGATFGVAEGGFLDWIPPEHAGCVDWSHVDGTVTFSKQTIMGFRLLRPVPGALLWVLDGDASWNGRLYEVLPDGAAHYVSSFAWNSYQAHYQAVWANVIPVSWVQIDDLARRGLVGADL